MTKKEKFKKYIQKNYKLFLKSTDLIKLGIFKNYTDVHLSRKNGTAPFFISLGKHKIIFPRCTLLDWIDENVYERKY